MNISRDDCSDSSDSTALPSITGHTWQQTFVNAVIGMRYEGLEIKQIKLYLIVVVLKICCLITATTVLVLLKDSKMNLSKTFFRYQCLSLSHYFLHNNSVSDTLIGRFSVRPTQSLAIRSIIGEAHRCEHNFYHYSLCPCCSYCIFRLISRPIYIHTSPLCALPEAISPHSLSADSVALRVAVVKSLTWAN